MAFGGEDRTDPEQLRLALERGKMAVVGNRLLGKGLPQWRRGRQALNGLGYVNGKNVRFGQRYAERFPELANDLVSLSVADNRSAE